jgi:cytochrome c biogenesis protein CcmG/thiol:disulfide interchange protein DsbE
MLRSWKFWLVLAAIAAVAGLFAYGFTVDPKLVRSPLIGRPAPDFIAERLDGGEPVSLADFRGTPVILNFWASWCVACRDEAAVLQAAHVKYERGDGSLRVIGIAIQDTPEAARAFAQRYGKTYTLALDGDDGRIALDYGVYGVPETFFIGADGTILDKHVGPVTTKSLTAQVSDLLRASSQARR